MTYILIFEIENQYIKTKKNNKMIRGKIKFDGEKIIIKTAEGNTEIWERSKQDSTAFIIHKGIRYIPLAEE